MASLASASDGRLLRALRDLVVRDQQTEAELLRVLGEVDKRRLYLERGYSSLYAYCTEVLHMSEGVAYHRIKVARAGRDFPGLLECIRDGELHRSGAELLAPRLTAENQAELLDLARHQSKRAIEELLADRTPKPDAPSLVRRVPAIGPERGTGDVRRSAGPPVDAWTTTVAPAQPSPAQAPQARPPEPLGDHRYKIQFTATREVRDRLREAQALLRHQVPDGDLAEIFGRALTLLVKETRRRKFGAAKHPKSKTHVPAAARATRHVPAEIRREVEARDEGRCAFVSASGRRCGSRDFLEFHHKEPWARSRRHTVANLELRCRAHNQHAAVQDFGADYMARFRDGNRQM